MVVKMQLSYQLCCFPLSDPCSFVACCWVLCTSWAWPALCIMGMPGCAFTHQLWVVSNNTVLLIVQHCLSCPVEGAIDEQPAINYAKLMMHVRLQQSANTTVWNTALTTHPADSRTMKQLLLVYRGACLFKK